MQRLIARPLGPHPILAGQPQSDIAIIQMRLVDRLVRQLHDPTRPVIGDSLPDIERLYAPSVDFREEGSIPRSRVMHLLTEEAASARNECRVFQCIKDFPFPMDKPNQRKWPEEPVGGIPAHPGGFLFAVFTDPPAAPDGTPQPATASLMIFLQKVRLVPTTGIIAERVQTLPLYIAASAAHPLTAAEADQWTRTFSTRFTQEKISSPASLIRWKPSFCQSSLDLPEPFAKPDSDAGIVDRNIVISALHQTIPYGRPGLSGTISPAISLRGGRQRVIIPVKPDLAARRFTWTADLVFTDGRWQCAQIHFQTPHALSQ